MSAFMVGDDTMRRVYDAGAAMGQITIGASNASQYLWALNAWAMVERYGDRLDADEMQCQPLSHAPRPILTRRDAFMTFKALSCLSYQCAEGAAYRSEPYAWLDALKEAFARRHCAPLIGARASALWDVLEEQIHNTPEWRESGNWGD